jgi:glycosyltransferase involved in cell wall biosynthesis
MKLLMISDPSSIHTSNWHDGIKSRGIEIEIVFPKEWIYNNGKVIGSIADKTRILDVPSWSHLIGSSLRKASFQDLVLDLRNRTKLHQSLRDVGKVVGEYAIEGSFDFIHAHGMATSALLANACGFRPYSASAWGSDIYLMPDKYPYLKKIMAKTIADAAFVHVESSISAERLRQLSPQMKNRLLISTWGVDTDMYKPNVQTGEISKHLSLNENRYLLSFRSLEPIYQIDLIIKAFAIIAKEEKNLLLVIGGDGTCRANLVELSKELGLERRIIFTGFIEPGLKKDLFSQALLYIQCPKSDGVSLSMMEAMSSGQPLISSNVGETSILIESGLNGFLVDDVTSEKLADKIRKIVNDTELRARMSRMSRRIAVEKHNRDSFFNSFVNEIHRTLGEENR